MRQREVAEPTVADLLRRSPYFSELNPAQWEQVRSLLLERSFDKDEVLFLEGYPGTGLYFVTAGRIKIFKTSAEGKEQILHIVEAGDSFNDVPVFDGGSNPASAKALETATVYVLPKEDVAALLERYPALALGMLRVLASRLRHLAGLVEDLSFRHVTSRLAKVLLERTQETAASGLRRGWTQQELAAMVGTAREVVSRSLRNLEGQGAIRVDRHRIMVLNEKLLREIAWGSS